MNFKELCSVSIYYRLVSWKVFNGSLVVGIMAYIGATAAYSWSDLSNDARVTVCLSTIVAVCKFFDGFIDSTLNNLAKGKPPLSQDGDTAQWAKKPDESKPPTP